MGDKPLNKTALAAAIQNAPAVADVLKKLAGKVARAGGRFGNIALFPQLYE